MQASWLLLGHVDYDYDYIMAPPKGAPVRSQPRLHVNSDVDYPIFAGPQDASGAKTCICH